MPAQWPASASVAASCVVERARPEVAMLVLQLSAGRRSSAAADGCECARAISPRAMRNPMRDPKPIAVRSQCCMWTP
eukprot:5202941-Prymnesium_polylepis.1